ncbi:MAG: hypothetical protein V3R83_11740 [Gammaproteobacteria bacterium]
MTLTTDAAHYVVRALRYGGVLVCPDPALTPVLRRCPRDIAALLGPPPANLSAFLWYDSLERAEVMDVTSSLGAAARYHRVPVAAVERMLLRRPVGLLMLGADWRVLRTWPRRGSPSVAVPYEHTLPPHHNFEWMRLRDELDGMVP